MVIAICQGGRIEKNDKEFAKSLKKCKKARKNLQHFYATITA